MKSCKEFEYLPYHYSWDRHCGGNWGEFISRTITITDSVILAYAGIQINRASKIFGKSIGAGLFAKSTNDIYEAWTGNRGIIRDGLGDETYLAIDLALISFGFFKGVRKINYLGNPMHDFFTKDPLSYEYAFKQYSTLEIIHSTFSISMTAYNNSDKIAATLSIEHDWNEHLKRLHDNDQ